ncbi:hypothetical protein B7463_g11876, partial [Scytalidium lignicola]
MPSRSNPNVPNKQRRVANRSKVQKKRAVSKISKHPRGTSQSTVLYPTSGPLAPLSGKKARKVEKARNHARQRALEKEMLERGEVQMTDALKTTTTTPTGSKQKKQQQVEMEGKTEGEMMDVDDIA